MITTSRYGIVFETRDGMVCAAEYDPADWSVGDPDYEVANGWRVISLAGCCGDTLFPRWVG